MTKRNVARDRANELTREIKKLRSALETRDIIGQAKGMLMERHNIDAAAAFGLLVQLSQTSHTRVEVVAQKLVRGRASEFESMGRIAIREPHRRCASPHGTGPPSTASG